jgi:formylglycine-generating enzyme required for sulfatase activity
MTAGPVPLLALAAALLAMAPRLCAAPAAGTVFSDCAVDCPTMVVIPAGAFDMGSTEEERRQQGVPQAFADREGPRHRVTIARPFAMARTETLRAIYARFIDETKRPDPPGCDVHNAPADRWETQPGLSWRNPGFAQTDEEPAVCVSWTDAKAFAAWLARKTSKPYRLPTEAEWEYAARGGTTTARYWGDGPEDVCRFANIMTYATLERLGFPKSSQDRLVCAGPHAFTTKAGAYPANPFGLYDMIGNVWEWVEDCYHPNYVGAPTDGSAWAEAGCGKRIDRGGGFHGSPWVARAAVRSGPLDADIHAVGVGLRVVRDMD